MGLLDQGKESQSTADNIGRRDTFRFLKRKSESLKIEAGPAQLVTWGKGSVAMWNVAQWNVDVWDGVLGDRDIVGVVNNNNVFLEYFWHDRFVSPDTSATVDYGNHTVVFGGGETLESGTVFANDETIDNVRIKVNTSNLSNDDIFSYYYSDDGKSSWNELSNDVQSSASGTCLSFKMCTPSYGRDLLSYWSFDGTVQDFKGSNDGSVVGVSLTTGFEGVADTAYSFNGSSDYVAINADSSLDISGDLSIGAWVYQLLRLFVV